ncbi:hypothetical protein SAMN05421805_12430 [Saccharopolyspora antimicrobica]|uniref:Uncharacterized protein n=1 Tax=Saccharopolyspora antimicrobica TaxID=455193 RepID=A0A1I5JUF8_9PSEU|nr:hypothetical protein [Saccharopolyspora antimicrobica]RKT86946.1 hypothetical protein ATL45_5329 [Saccharopolyspora antimicrobica]SFO76464.1 hypothetical protein SAMN05421805_12430 [Saccharopolyspora antimicrobica]
MVESDQGHWRGVHWHTYIAFTNNTMLMPPPRSLRLVRIPDRVLRTPEEACAWVTTMMSRHAHRTPVHFIGPSGGRGHVADRDHIARNAADNLAVLRGGHSIYQDFAREYDRMHLWLEASDTTNCRAEHVAAPCIS